MNTQKNAIRKLAAFAGLTAAGVLISLPGLAEGLLNPNPSIFNEFPYNRRNAEATPSPTTPATEAAPTSMPEQAPAAEAPASAPEAEATTATPEATPTAEAENNIIQTAAASGTFETLTAALQAAGLSEALSTQGPVTVFAPTDEAFAALPEGTVEELLKPENREKLVRLLAYHVIAGEVTSDELKSGEVATAEGSSLQVTVDTASNEVMVNDAKVVQADVKATNGVIHAIDKVIMPPEM